MGTNWFTKLFFQVADWIERKLSTKEGKLTLVISSSMLTAGSIIFGVNKNNNYVELYNDREKLIKDLEKSGHKVDSIQNKFNEYIASSDNRCNEQIKQGALLHQQLRDIYENKTINTQSVIQEEKIVIQERKEAVKEQKQHIKQLEKLSNGKP